MHFRAEAPLGHLLSNCFVGLPQDACHALLFKTYVAIRFVCKYLIVYKTVSHKPLLRKYTLNCILFRHLRVERPRQLHPSNENGAAAFRAETNTCFQ